MEDEVAELRAEVARLTALLRLTRPETGPPGPVQSAVAAPHTGLLTAASPAAAKIALFTELFATRSDVHAVRWENQRKGTSGWMPAARGRWRRGMDASSADLLPITPEVVADHLTGTLDLGLYSIAPGDTCRWLAADFDGPFAMLDALAYLKAARAAAVPAVLEVSRSGEGAHAWVFFAEQVPAGSARQLGFGLLREAMGIRGRMSLASYDRFFPSQDVLPAAGFGNLIAAPLQGRCRARGATVFLDLATMEPHVDQWALLSSVDRMSARAVARVAGALKPPAVGQSVTDVRNARATRIQHPAPAVVRVRIAAQVTVTGADLTPAMAATLRHAASIRNPDFDQRQRLRRSTWDVPRFIIGYDETLDGDLVLPRGLLPLVKKLVAEQGSRLDLTDERTEGKPQKFHFTATLRNDQAEALADLAGHDFGVLVAPPGSGKTVIACALAARVGVSTLVLVDRTALAEQWRGQIADLLGLKAGQLGGGRKKRRGVVDIATMQTLARRDDVAEVAAGYGLVIVDECHHVPAATVERVVRQIPARRWLGLTATPQRRDGLEEIIAWQLGPVRHTMGAPGSRIGELPLAGTFPSSSGAASGSQAAGDQGGAGGRSGADRRGGAGGGGGADRRSGAGGRGGADGGRAGDDSARSADGGRSSADGAHHPGGGGADIVSGDGANGGAAGGPQASETERSKHDRDRRDEPGHDAPSPRPVLLLHDTSYRYLGSAEPSEPGGMAAIYRDLVADEARLQQVVEDVREALARGRHCLVLTQWKEHVRRLAEALGAELGGQGGPNAGSARPPETRAENGSEADSGADVEPDVGPAISAINPHPEPVVLIGGMGVRARTAAMAHLDEAAAHGQVLLIATGPLIGEGFDLPVLDTLFLAAPISFPGRLVQYAGRVLRPWPGKTTAEVHDYVDVEVPVLRSSLTNRARGYTDLGFPDPRRM